MIEAAIHGFLLALGLILPLGVQNIFIFNQGAGHANFRNSLPAVVTASICDTLLILLSVLGVSLFLFHVVWLKTLLLIAGACFLVYMGYVTWKSKPNPEGGETLSAGKQIGFALSVSLLNPHAIMDTVGVIGTSSLLYSGTEKQLFALSCILVSWLWFIGLAITGRMLGKVDKTGNLLVLLNKASALVMWVMAIVMAKQLL
ncbi:LysE/ArgO family amino acid transporter [Niallia taxi]|uniref:LysE/ArgO family amino acid transporter n=1 Tax=Niallia taxi TaxID=2499688 RepID=UPI00203CEE66|nr:LysE/ArgO family amino acid transporter [Niallia taxi]MCM3216465.1 LysE/ArgO family amino acid transporter [Niallia taxi]